MSKKTLREQFLEAGKGDALIMQKKKALEESRKLDAAYGKDNEKSLKSDTEGWNGLTPAELKDDWENLRRKAKVEFPEGADETTLSENNRLVAIAHGLGWSYDRIAKSSGLKKSTIATWLSKRPDIALFLKKFQMKIGEADLKPFFDDIIFNFVSYVQKEMREIPTSDSEHRRKKELGIWAYESQKGKAAENIKVTGYDDVVRAMAKDSSAELSKDAEAKLFAITKKK